MRSTLIRKPRSWRGHPKLKVKATLCDPGRLLTAAATALQWLGTRRRIRQANALVSQARSQTHADCGRKLWGVRGQRQPITLPMEAVLEEQETLQWAPAGGRGVSQSLGAGLSKHEEGSKKAPLSWASGQSETSPGSEHMWWKIPWAAGDRGSRCLASRWQEPSRVVMTRSLAAFYVGWDD